MADDIVTQLHQWRRYNDGDMLTSPSGELSLTLAAAINEIERLRAAGDELVASLTPVSFAGPHEAMNRLERAYLAWQEARRG